MPEAQSTARPASSAGVRARYQERWRLHDEARAEAAVRSRRLSTERGFTFLAVVGAVVLVDYLAPPWERLALAGMVLLIGLFGLQVVRHRRARTDERWQATLAGIAWEGVLRIERRWTELEEALPPAERPAGSGPQGHPYARDLDIRGRASLWRLLGPVTSRRARNILEGWLLEPGAPEVARRRQEAVREVAGRGELRTEIAALGRVHTPDELGSWERFLAWAEAPGVLAGKSWLVRSGFVLPVLLVGTIAGDVFLGLGPWWLPAAVLQLVVARTAARLTHETFAAASTAAGPMKGLVPQLRCLDESEWSSAILQGIREGLGRGDEAAHLRLGALARWLDTLDSRANIVYATLAPLLLLDVHLAAGLERWKANDGGQVRRWLDATAEWEALSALSTLAHDHPEWVFPDLLESGGQRMTAEALGHPLLPPDDRVHNDVEVGPPGTFVLVTGSNMSGKSTLLRAIGLNAVLAGAGAPVCARALSTPCLRVYTCMRVEDSLEAGVSLFMAELLRIRDVVEAARAADPLGRPVLYLLDEMLHGTNTAERRVAARGVITHLIESGAIGAVSTHDLALAESPELQEAARPVHFREEVSGRGEDGRPVITFDYRMRPGIATTRNALKLLEAVGLTLPDSVTGDAR